MADAGTSRSALVFGLFFIAAGVMFLLDRLDVWHLEARYLLPTLLIVLGIVVLIGGFSRSGDGRSPGRRS
jgi:hypothetical protein